MGYDIDKITIHIRLSRHNSDQDVADNEARDRLLKEIGMLIAADPDYSRITVSVW